MPEQEQKAGMIRRSFKLSRDNGRKRFADGVNAAPRPMEKQASIVR